MQSLELLAMQIVGGEEEACTTHGVSVGLGDRREGCDFPASIDCDRGAAAAKIPPLAQPSPVYASRTEYL